MDIFQNINIKHFQWLKKHHKQSQKTNNGLGKIFATHKIGKGLTSAIHEEHLQN